MGHGVLLQVRGLPERLATQITVVRPLARVGPHVNREVVFPFEGFPAKLTVEASRLTGPTT